MKNSILYFLIFISPLGLAQPKLVLNGGYINITNGAKMVIENNNPDAIIRNSGHIISEGENNEVKWVIANQTGSYTLPFGYTTSDYIPVTFTKTAGTGLGFFNFATYRTSTWLNSAYLPTGVSHSNDALGNDNSANMIDRFWKIEAQGYSTKPDFTDLAFTYIDIEHSVASNTITESALSSQRFNSTISTWADFSPSVSLNTTTNTLSVSSIPTNDLFVWWTLVSPNPPLPINLIRFYGTCNGASVQLEWETLSNPDEEIYVLERSTDGLNWKELYREASKPYNIGNSHFEDHQPLDLSYYRIKTVDKTVQTNYSSILMLSCKESNPEIVAYPSLNSGNFIIQNAEKGTEISVKNILGQDLQTIISNGTSHVISIDLPSGVYFLHSKNTHWANKSIKIVIEK